MSKPILLPGALPLLAGILILSMILGCSDGDPGQRIPNTAPVVQITGGPLEGSRESYTARIYWSGYDNDGIITHYEYALDPPSLAVIGDDTVSVFTDEEINYPENSSDVLLELIPGPTELQDTLRVCKVVQGEVFCFDWVETIEFSRAFAFETPEAETTFAGTLIPTEFFTGYHTLYVRAQDNNDMFSVFDRVGYTAETLVPEAEITSPSIEAEILNVGPTLTIRFEGQDLDSPDPNKKPEGFLYKLLRVDTLEPSISLLIITSTSVLYSKGDPTWTYVDGDTADITLFLGSNGSYVFGIRAVDVAGAEEPFLDFGRNAFKFQSLPSGGRPDLKIEEPSLGQFPPGATTFYRGTGRVEEAEVPVGQKLRFTWQGSAEDYGGTIEGYSWGLDIPDLDREGPNSGWSGWGPITGNFDPIVFVTPGVHVLYVRVRDISGTVTLGTLILKVVDFPLDREVLYVDDSFDDTKPNDDQHDEFWLGLFTGYGKFSQVFEFHAHGDRDRGALAPQRPTLEELGRYQMVLWECRGSGYNGQTALVSVSDVKPVLGPYLSAGGKLWLGGRMTVAATTVSGNDVSADLAYPKDLTTRAGNFAYTFLKLHSTLINNDKADDPRNTFWAALPASEVRPELPDPYPGMETDPGKLNLAQIALGGFSHCDAVFDPIFAEQEPGFLGDVDTLYFYGAAGPIRKGKSSSYHKRLCALRWHDPDPDRRHGRTQWFGFSMYYMFANTADLPQESQDAGVTGAQEVFNKAMDWFQEEQVPGIGP